jgi:hypothetical protein
MTGDEPTAQSSTEWRLDVADSPLLLGLAYAFPGVLGGVVVVGLGVLTLLVVDALADGDPGRAVGLLVLVLLAVAVRRYLLAVPATDAAASIRERYSRRGLAVASVVGAAALLGSAALGPLGPAAVFLVGGVALVFTAAFPTTGRVDPAAGRFVVDGSEVPLASVRRVRTASAGPVAVCLLSYVRGAPRAPRLVCFPPGVLADVREAIDRAGPPADGDSTRTLGRAERLVATAFGLGLVAVGPLLWVALPPGDGRAIALYAGTVFGLFGTVFLWYAYAG